MRGTASVAVPGIVQCSRYLEVNQTICSSY